MKRVSTLTLMATTIAVGAGLGLTPEAYGQAKGKISKNFYRIPYADATTVRMNRDYIDHGNTPAGNTGPMDMVGLGNAPFFIVAAADGVVTSVNDTLVECGCDSAYGPCANVIQIRHENGEMSKYLHIQGNSAMVNVDDCVSAGDLIAIEGDVGWTCGGGRAANAGSCVLSVPNGAGACGPHLHWEVFRESTGEFMNPLTCGIDGNIYADGGQYDAGICGNGDCPDTLEIPAVGYSGMGTFKVYQADQTIEADSFLVQNSASVVLHAGESITLRPGFHITPGGHFRADIGPCDQTANAGCP